MQYEQFSSQGSFPGICDQRMVIHRNDPSNGCARNRGKDGIRRMKEEQTAFQVGDQVIHWVYGLGEIVDLDEKVLAGRICQLLRFTG